MVDPDREPVEGVVEVDQAEIPFREGDALFRKDENEARQAKVLPHQHLCKLESARDIALGITEDFVLLLRLGEIDSDYTNKNAAVRQPWLSLLKCLEYSFESAHFVVARVYGAAAYALDIFHARYDLGLVLVLVARILEPLRTHAREDFLQRMSSTAWSSAGMMTPSAAASDASRHIALTCKWIDFPK